jgi:NAD(P)-dependent dehydrogenase (short-subunit alcohol dehydrogenase family)
MEIRLDGKVALVTGASRGIGRAIALEFARSGADVAINYREEAEWAEQVCDEIRRMGRETITVQADVADVKQVEQMVEKVARHFKGHLDILVNNAGLYPYTEALQMKDEEWNRVIDTNLKGAFYVSRAVARKMMEGGRGGRIIGIASGAGHSGRQGQTHYCASKAGLILMCKSLAIEWAPYNINVNTISVGFVDVGQFEKPEMREMKEFILRRILLRRPGMPQDIANAALFLASEQADWITGSDFRVDGGESAGRIPE